VPDRADTCQYRGYGDEGHGEVRRHTTAAAALTACAALLAGCGQAELGAASASASVPAEERTDEVRCRESEPRLESLSGALETLELANAETFESAHTVTTSALTSWTDTFEDAPEGPLAEAYESGQRRLAHLERMDATTPHPELVEWTAATLDTATDVQSSCEELTANW
jgi:hypothetical protein